MNRNWENNHGVTTEVDALMEIYNAAALDVQSSMNDGEYGRYPLHWEPQDESRE